MNFVVNFSPQSQISTKWQQTAGAYYASDKQIVANVKGRFAI